MQEKFKISDIFRKQKEIKKRQLSQGIRFYRSKSNQEEASEEPAQDKIDFSSLPDKQPDQKQPEAKQPGGKQSGRKKSEPGRKKSEQSSAASDSKSNELYIEAMACARDLYKTQLNQSDIVKKITNLIKKMINLISSDNEKLLDFALANYPRKEDYLYHHLTNVCIMSLCIAQALDYERSALVKLGIAAFLHDVGISRYLEIINQPRKLNQQEFNQVKEHPVAAPDVLKKISKGLDKTIIEIIRQEHERIDGSGYPEGLKDDQITEYAQIVGLSDVYEAMIHPRPYRERNTPLETIKTILSNKYAFSHKLVKVLIDRIGIFPVGTFVQLNTREAGQVIKRNPDLPLRPIVDIAFDASGKRLKESRRLDLADNPTIYILGITSMPA